MIVYEETQYYSAGELAAIFGALVSCGIGISFLYAKTKALKSAGSNRSALDKGDKLGQVDTTADDESSGLKSKSKENIHSKDLKVRVN